MPRGGASASGSAAESEIMTFDYSLPAELYLAKRGALNASGFNIVAF